MESVKVVTVKPIEATPSTFKDYGQVIEPSPDHQGFGPHDAQLDLTQGIPRSFLFHPSIFINLSTFSAFSQITLLPLINSNFQILTSRHLHLM
jgi:hypothetical protein